MKRVLCAGALLLLIASPALLRNKAVAQTPAAATDQHREMLDTYCFTCHNTAVKAGGLALDALDLQNAPDDAKTWEKALRKLRGHLMPPPGNPQPPQKDIDVVRSLDGKHARCPSQRIPPRATCRCSA